MHELSQYICRQLTSNHQLLSMRERSHPARPLDDPAACGLLVDRRERLGRVGERQVVGPCGDLTTATPREQRWRPQAMHGPGLGCGSKDERIALVAKMVRAT